MKETYIDIINGSTLFYIDKERDSALYQEEFTRFAGILYEYYLNYISYEAVSDYGLEFYNAVRESLKYFDSTKGSFLNYFSKVFKQKYTIAKAKEISEQVRGGIKISNNEQKLIYKIQNYLKSQNKGELSDNQLNDIAMVLNIDKCLLYEILCTNNNLQVVSHIVKTEDDEFDLYDKQPVYDNNVEEREFLTEKLDFIEKTFNSLQNRRKTNEIISILLTMELIDAIGDYLEIDKLNYSFIDKNTIDLFKNQSKILSQKELARRFNVSEQSLSRTYNSFKEKLKNRD